MLGGVDKRNFALLAALAAANDNVVTRAQLSRIGFTDKHIGLLLKRRQWVRLQRGVYLVAPGPPSWNQLARSAQLAGGDSLALDGVRVVCIEDGLLSLSALTKDRRQLEVVVESVLLSRKSTEKKLWRFVGLNSRPGLRGVALLRSVLEERPNGKPSRSILELEVLDLIRAAGLPIPSRNVDVVDGDGARREIDLCYLEQRGAIEADSKRWHSTASQVADDQRRQSALEAVGFSFVRITWPDVTQRPNWVIEQIRGLLLRLLAA